MDIQMLKSLPTLEELSKLDSNDAEAKYIFEFTLNTLMNTSSATSCSFEEASYLIQSLCDRTWEQINSGIFQNVPLDTRKVYSAACLLKIVFLLHDSDKEAQILECFKILDNALLVGCTLGLYSRAEELIRELADFMNEKTGLSSSEPLAIIQPIKYEEACQCDVERVDCPSLELFSKSYFTPQKPVLLRNTISHWPAVAKWRDPNYLLRIAGNRYVPIEIGSNYATEEWSQEMTKLKEFLVRQFGSGTCENDVEYLAQHELFDQIPILKEDIRIPDYCCLGCNELGEVDIKAWLGPAGTVSPMHQDPKHNILCQVFGCKKIILASRDDTELLYPHDGQMLGNTSQVDAENLDFEAFPLVKRVKFYHIKLQEGDALYIPPKWWHHVRSLSKSFSVSFWWE